MADRIGILALDLGTTCGWAHHDGHGITGGTEKFETRRHESHGMRWLRFRRWLDEAGDDVRLVAYEEVRRHAATDAAHCYGGFLASLHAWCCENGVEYIGIPVGTIKKTATGKGNADKTAMIEACRVKLGIDPVDDNEADARWLLHHIVEVEKL